MTGHLTPSGAAGALARARAVRPHRELSSASWLALAPVLGRPAPPQRRDRWWRRPFRPGVAPPLPVSYRLAWPYAARLVGGTGVVHWVCRWITVDGDGYHGSTCSREEPSVAWVATVDAVSCSVCSIAVRA